jgi:hypothetical protein
MVDSEEYFAKNSGRSADNALPSSNEKKSVEEHAPAAIAESERQTDNSNVKIGDVIFISREIPSIEAGKSKSVKYIIAADSFMTTQVTLVKENESESQVGICLFRVECTSSVSDKKSDKHFAKRAQEVEQHRNEGRELHYGEVVQLRHLQSGLILAISPKDAARTAGSWKVILTDKVDKNCWLRLMPSEVVQDEGHLVKYNDRMRLAFRAERLYFYLNLRVSEGGWEVNAYQVQNTLHIHNFQPYSEERNLVKYGAIVRLWHKDTRQHLCVCSNIEHNWLSLLKSWASEVSRGLQELIELAGQPQQASLRLDNSKFYYDGLWVVENIKRLEGSKYIGGPCYLRSVLTGEYLHHNLTLNEAPDVNCLFMLEPFHKHADIQSIEFGTEILIWKPDIPRSFIAFESSKPKDNLLSQLTMQPSRGNKVETKVQEETDYHKSNLGTFEILDLPQADVSFALQIANFIKFIKKFITFIDREQERGFLSKAKEGLSDLDHTKENFKSLRQGYKQINKTIKKSSSNDFKSFQMALVKFSFPVITIAVCSKITENLRNIRRSLGSSLVSSTSLDPYFKLRKAALKEMVKNLSLTSHENAEAAKVVSSLHSEVYPLIQIAPNVVGTLLAMIYSTTNIDVREADTQLKYWFRQLQSVRKDNIEVQTYLLKIITNLIKVDNKANLGYQNTFLELMFNSQPLTPIIKLAKRDKLFICFPSYLELSEFISYNDFDQFEMVHKENDVYFDFIQVCERQQYQEYIEAALKLYSSLLTNNNDNLDFISSITGLEEDLLKEMAADTSINLSVRSQLLALSCTIVMSKLGVSSFSERVNKNFCFSEADLIDDKAAFYESFEPNEHPEVKDSISQISNYLSKFWLNPANSDLQAQAKPTGKNKMYTTGLLNRLDYLLTVMTITYEIVDRQLSGELFLESLSRSFISILIGFSKDNIEDPDAHWLVNSMREAKQSTSNHNVRISLVKVVEKLMQLYFLLVNIRNYRRAKNHLILYNRSKDRLSNAELSLLANDFEKIDELYRVESSIRAGNYEMPSHVRKYNDSFAVGGNQTPVKYSLEQHSYYILEMIFSDLDIPQELSGELLAVHYNLIDDSSDLMKRLQSAELITRDLDQLKADLDDVNTYLSNKRLKSRLSRYFRKAIEPNTHKPDLVAETESTLVKLLKNVQPRKNKSALFFTTAQNICRLNRIYEKLLDLWDVLHEHSANDDAFRLISLITTALLFIIYDNPSNQKKVKKLLKPINFNLRLPKLPAIIKETNSISRLKPDDFSELLTGEFERHPVGSSEFKSLLHWLSVILFNEDDTANLQTQDIVSVKLFELILNHPIPLEVSTEFDLLAATYNLLANCAVNNPIVIQKCRKLISAKLILTKIVEFKNELALVETLLSLYSNVYLVTFPGLESGQKQIEDAGSIMKVVNQHLSKAANTTENLALLTKRGTLSFAIDSDDPVKYDIAAVNQPETDDLTDLWKCLYTGDLWENKSGLLFFIQAAVSLAKSKIDESLVSEAKSTSEQLQLLQSELQKTVGHYQWLDISILMKGVQVCLSEVESYLKFMAEPEIRRLSVNFANKHSKASSEQAEAKDEGTIEDYINHLEKRQIFKDRDTVIGEIADQIMKIEKISKVFRADVHETDINNCVGCLVKMKGICSSSKSRVEFFMILEVLARKGRREEPTDSGEIEPNSEQMNIENFIEVVLKARILEDLIHSITESESLLEKSTALSLLLVLLSTRLKDIQKAFVEVISRKDRAYRLFLAIKDQLTVSRKRITTNFRNIDKDKSNSIWQKAIKFNTKAKEKSEDPWSYTTNLLRMLQTACDNCHKQSQDFMREQKNDQGRSINMVEAVTTYFVEVIMTQFHWEDEEALTMIEEAIQALIEFATGPNQENQNLLANSALLFQSINILMEKITDIVLLKKPEYQNLVSKYINVYQKLTKLLLTFLEGANRKDIAKVMADYLNLTSLKQQVETIYNTFIKNRTRSVKLEIRKVEGRQYKTKEEEDNEISEDDFNIINTGVLLAIVITILKESVPNNPILETCRGDTSHSKSQPNDPGECYDFFNSYIGCVEVKYNELEEVYFPIPFKSKFLTTKSKHDIIYNVSRESPQEKIEDFLQKFEIAKVEMLEQQKLGRKTAVKAITKHWSTYYLLSYLMIFGINIIMISTIDSKAELELDSNSDVAGSQLAMTILGILQLFFTVLGFSCYIVEYYKKIITAGQKLNLLDFEMEDYCGMQHNDSMLMDGLYTEIKNKKNKGTLRSLTYIISHSETLYHVFIFFPLSFISLFYPILYPWLLLDIVKRSESIRNIVKSIVINMFQLTMTGFLGLIMIYIFSVLGFIYFNNCYDNCDDYSSTPMNGFSPCGDRVSQFNTFCNSLSDCFTTTLTFGIRMGGGIGEAIKSPVKNDSQCDYWSRMAFDLLFFVVIILILLNIIFGIIIDTYADLKEKRLKINIDVNDSCYICGGFKNELTKDSKGWSEHFMNKHSVFAYLAFIVYISEKNEEDCNGLEKSVKTQIDAKTVGFFPIKDNKDD